MTTLVGRYEVTQTLGGGGFAITYLARDIMQPSKPLCVVKQLRPNQTHPRVIEFFHKEAAILEKLGKHPQIPQLLAHFQEGDNLYIVQEFIQGHDLSNVKPFFMGKFVVTQAQYEAIMGENPSGFKGDKRPVEKVSWNDATEFCQKLTAKTGRTYRLPSEAEWEYAFRAGTTTPFHFGETITTNLANYNGEATYANAPKGEYSNQTTEVGSFPPNAFGLYDMHGNVWEWCQDTWHENYNGAPKDGSAWVDNSSLSVLRGGSWNNYPVDCRSASRYGNYGAGGRVNIKHFIGFRVVCAFGRDS